MRLIGLTVVLTLGLILAPLAAEAQLAGKVPRVGILAGGSAAEAPNTSFFDRMRELGYIEGRTVAYERRFADGRIDDLPTLAAQLMTTKPDVIFAPVTPAALAARQATQTIPIVFAVSADPVGAGLVTSLRQPGGNVTGLSSMNTELVAKRMQLLKDAAPRISRVALFWNPDNVPDRQQLNALSEVAPKLGLAVIPIVVRTADDYELGFADARAKNADAVMIIPSPLTIQSRRKILDFAVRGRLPTLDAGAWNTQRAARGLGAARGEGAADRVVSHLGARVVRRGLPAGPTGARLHRRSKHCYRMAIGQRRLRPPAYGCRRTAGSQRRHRRCQRNACRAGPAEADDGNPYRHGRGNRSSSGAPCRKSSARSEDYPLRRSHPAARSGSRQSARDDSPRGSVRLLRSDRLSEHAGDSSDS